MDPQHRQILQENQVYLLENITYEDICDHLIGKQLVSYDKHDQIMAEKGNRAKIREFLSHLPRGGPHAFHAFVNIFKECEPPRPDIVGKLCRPYDTVDFRPSQHPSAIERRVEEPTNLFTKLHPYTTQPSHAYGLQPAPISTLSGSLPTTSGVTTTDATAVTEGARSAATAEPNAHPCAVPAAARALSALTVSDTGADWFYTSLTEVQRSMLCKDKLFAKLCLKIPDIQQLGIWLGIDYGEINQIQQANPFSVANQVLDILHRWKQRTQPPTVKQLVHALREADIPVSSYQQAVSDFCNNRYT